MHPDAVCIGSDTMVTIDGLPLGKPADVRQAADMLRHLRGRTHEVLTGLAVLPPDGAARTLCTRTRDSAIAEGSYDLMAEGSLRLSYLTEDASIVIGDTVETSGAGGVFPKGVMIGTVESVLPEENGISYYAVLKPFVDVETVTNVSVVTAFTDTTE